MRYQIQRQLQSECGYASLQQLCFLNRLYLLLSQRADKMVCSLDAVLNDTPDATLLQASYRNKFKDPNVVYYLTHETLK